jgi:hypothetical protein
MQFIFRFLAGGVVVSLFAVIGDGFKPKSFAGLFGAAPSVALATLVLAVFSDGKNYAALEARSMIAGGVAFFIYSCLCMYVLAKCRFGATLVTVSALVVWLAGAIAGWLVFLR